MSSRLKSEKNKNQSFITNDECKEFSYALKDLLLNKKEGHLGVYHYGEPITPLDTVKGAELWDRFVRYSDNYYQFKAENVVLPVVAEYLSDLVQNEAVSVIDLGPGSNTALHAKTFPFLSTIQNVDNYLPVDISSEYLREIGQAVRGHFPSLNISLQRKNYFSQSLSFDVNTIPVFLFLSSNVSNLPEASMNGDYKKQLRSILTHFYQSMHTPGYLVISHDSNQDEQSLIQAYSDPLHVDFSLNILHRIMRDGVDSDCNEFEPDAWTYRPEWMPERSLLAHCIYSNVDQQIKLDGFDHYIKKGHRVVVDNSHKYKVPDFMNICIEAGFSHIKTFMDDAERMAVYILKRDEV